MTWMINFLTHYGYLAVALLIFLEDFGMPTPGETILVLAAIAAGRGHLNLLAIMLVGWAAAVLGDNLGYAIGRYGGRSFVHHYGRYFFVTAKRLRDTEAFFKKYGGRIVIVARFIDGLRQLNGIIAGIARMRWATFLLYNMIGGALWVAVWSCVGFYFGRTFQEEALKYSAYLGAILLAFLAGFAVSRLAKSRVRK